MALFLRIGELGGSVLHNEPKNLTFKLARYTRFRYDKSPYNPTFLAHISSKGKLTIPVGYYLMIKPGNQSFLGGGLFADVFKDATAMVRDYTAGNCKEFETIIHDPEFEKYFSVQRATLKNVPAGYNKGHPQAGYLKYHSVKAYKPFWGADSHSPAVCTPVVFILYSSANIPFLIYLYRNPV